MHFNVTAHPTAEWKARQILEAFPFDLAAKYLLRDRDRIYGHAFREQVAVMQIKEVLGAPRSPWQRAYVERVIGSIRRECLDHVIVLDEKGLRRVLASYFSITDPAFICRWIKIHQIPDRYSRSEELSRFRKLVACITGTNGALPDGVAI